MEDRKALLSAIAAAATVPAGEDDESARCSDVSFGCGGRYEALLAYVKRHSARSDNLNIAEVFQTVSKKNQSKLWAQLLDVVTPIVEDGLFLPQEAPEQDGERWTTDTGDRRGTSTAGDVTGDAHDDETPQRTLSSSGGDRVTSRPQRRAAGDEDGCGPGDVTGNKRRSDADVSLALQVLHAVTTLAHEFVLDKGCGAPRPLLETAVQLHSIILSLQGLQGVALQGLISKVCEMWWLQERPGGEHLVVQLLPLMLVRSLDDDAREADVKRMYGMRTALLLLDFEDETSVGLRSLLLRLFISPLYLKSAEGKRLLAYLFGLHPAMVTDIHAVIKAQIPGARRTVLAAYGEIYFRVWRGAAGPYLEKLELGCLQDLMHACIHASAPKMHANILAVLNGVHSQKKAKGVDATLLRLYGPVLWRALRVANPTVRAHACRVLVDVFPLQDPNAGAASYDAVLQQQFDALTTLLEDGNPQVRAIAAKGVCRILSVFWEVVPMPTTRALLARVVGRLASDAASPLVRLGAVEGLSLLLGCRASHSVLKAMLPGVSNLIHDTNKRVRLAFVKLLGQVKGIRAIKYYNIVPVNHILARLAEDHTRCPAVASGLAKLLLNSYYPTGSEVTGSMQVSRCLTLLVQDEGAAVAFYSRLHQHAGVPSATKLLAMLFSCVVVEARQDADENEADGTLGRQEDVSEGRAVEVGTGTRKVVKAGGRKGKRKGSDYDAERCDDNRGGHDERTLKASNTKLMAALLNMIATVWESISSSLQKPVHEACLALVQETVTGEALAVLHGRFSSVEGCRAAFMRVAGLAGADLAPDMLEDLVVEMLGMPADAQPAIYGPTVDVLCSWGQHEHLLGAIVDSLEKAFAARDSDKEIDDGGRIANDSEDTHGVRSKRRRPPSSRRGDDSDSSSGEAGLPAALALSMLNHVLAGGHGHAATAASRDAIMADHMATERVQAALSLARDRADERLCKIGRGSTPAKNRRTPEAQSGQCPNALLVRALEAVGRVHLHREAAKATADASSDLTTGGGGGVQDSEGEAGARPAAVALQPIPFSLKMRELMVWTTHAVLPLLTGHCGVDEQFVNVAGKGDDQQPAGATPVKSAAARLPVAESPSPLPPPRSKPRANEDDSLATAAMGATATESEITLARGILGVMVLLAGEWLEVGSGLAEISMRADTWANLLLGLLLQPDEASYATVAAVLPYLCRLSLQLSTREPQGARPPEALWQVVLRCADCRGRDDASADEGEERSRGPTYVQDYLAASVALQGRRAGLPTLLERLLGFVFTQASLGDGDGQDAEEEHVSLISSTKGAIRNGLARLEVRGNSFGEGQDGLVSASEPMTSVLRLTSPAEAVLASIIRSTPASKAAGSLVLSHLGSYRPSTSGEDASWPLFCGHMLSVLLDQAPAGARLQIAADAHEVLKAPAAEVTAAALAMASPVDMTASASVEEEAEVTDETHKLAGFVISAVYDRLEAVRRAALSPVAEEREQGVGVSSDFEGGAGRTVVAVP